MEKELNWEFGKKTALFTFHPETLADDQTLSNIQNILSTIDKMELSVLFTYANADDNGRIINEEIEKFCHKNPLKYKVVKSLGQLRYLSAMKHVDLMIGNTSSGIIEAASFKKPVINIGDRQKGRLQSGNVIDSAIEGLETAIKCALESDFSEVENIYGKGDASDKIVQILEISTLSTTKKFIDLG